MKHATTAFYGDALQLDCADVARLLMGETLDTGGLKVAYERLPDTGCRCPNCVERLSVPQDGEHGS